MLVELPDPRQIKDEGHRRWFSDDYFDLIVWYDLAETTIVGFQLCYDKRGLERAITWQRGRGFSHNRIDDGETVHEHAKMSPVLVSDGVFLKETVSDRFKASSTGIHPNIAELVYKKIREYPE